MSEWHTKARAAPVGFLLALLPLVAACDPSRDEPPPKAPACKPAPACPPCQAGAPLGAGSANDAPSRAGVTKGAPTGIAVEHWIAGGLCNLERLGNTVLGSEPVRLGASVRTSLTGWALDPAGKLSPELVYVRFSSPSAGDYYGAATKRLVRDDVTASYDVTDRSTRSGFEVEFDSGQLPEGTYLLTTVMQAGGKSYVCDNGRKLTRDRN